MSKRINAIVGVALLGLATSGCYAVLIGTASDQAVRDNARYSRAGNTQADTTKDRFDCIREHMTNPMDVSTAPQFDVDLCMVNKGYTVLGGAR